MTNDADAGLVDNAEIEQVAVTAALRGGEILFEMLGKIKARQKGPRDLVTEADLASQKKILDVILTEYPQHMFVGEEDMTEDLLGDERSANIVTDGMSLRDVEYCWVVDPLDGTTNYVHQLPGFAVSIGLLHYGEAVVGAVVDPIRHQVFRASKGNGAWLGDQRITVSDCRQLDEALVAASFSARVPRHSPEIERFIEMLHACQALRRTGSAALNMCNVACGGLDGYWATSVKMWDIAAGVAIVNEAGGMVTHIDGGSLDIENPQFVASSNDVLHAQMLDRLAIK
ncbi:MAG: inositol monophosphatase family protein [Pirellulaceae bacterium]